MFENYREMSPIDQAIVKRIHNSIKNLPPDRYRNLAWAYVRGFKYRRVERKRRTQLLPNGATFEHNLPSDYLLCRVFETVGLVTRSEIRDTTSPARAAVIKWLSDESGAIPAPPPREKHPYVAPTQERAAE